MHIGLGSLYSEGETNTEPNVMRVYGTWTSVHSATGAKTGTKWYGVLNFNDDNKIATFSDWMDVNGIQVQIENFVNNNLKTKNYEKLNINIYSSSIYWLLINRRSSDI